MSHWKDFDRGPRAKAPPLRSSGTKKHKGFVNDLGKDNPVGKGLNESSYSWRQDMVLDGASVKTGYWSKKQPYDIDTSPKRNVMKDSVDGKGFPTNETATKTGK